MSVDLDIIDKIAVITINRPEAMNAIDPETNEQLDAIWDEFRDNPDLWVAILTGAGQKAWFLTMPAALLQMRAQAWRNLTLHLAVFCAIIHASNL